VGCGSTRPKRELLRLALDGELVVADERAVLPGRGTYVCDAACYERAVSRKAFSRAFRRNVRALESLER
jgi:predicted RNA-binding protein YlxR (DUF448 family)